MNDDVVEKKLRHLFHKMRNQDALRAPSFGRMLEPAAHPCADARSSLSFLTRPRFAAAAAVLLVIGVGMFALRTNNIQQESQEAQEWTSFPEWNTSTDSILSVSTSSENFVGNSFNTSTDGWFSQIESTSTNTKNEKGVSL